MLEWIESKSVPLEKWDIWTARLVVKGTIDPRVEIRRTFRGTQCLIVVRDHGDIHMSLNSIMVFKSDTFNDFNIVIKEALIKLKDYFSAKA